MTGQGVTRGLHGAGAGIEAPPIVELRNAGKRFGSVTALHDVTLALRSGEVTAVLGPNGAGKTTLIGLMLGLLHPTTGSARLFGLHPQSRAGRERTGVMLQISGLPATLKVRELVRLFRLYYPEPLPLDDILEFSGLVGLEERLYGNLSGGEQQRVHLALAICGDPKLLFLDEPTAKLDIELRREFWKGVERAIERGCTVLFTTHHLDEADAYAERIVVIHKGRVAADGPKAEIKARVAGKRVRVRTRLKPEALRTEPLVHEVERVGDRLEFVTERPEALIPRLTALDPDLSDLEVGAGALEDVFLSLIRDQGDGPRPR